MDSLYDIPPKYGEETDGEESARSWGPYFLGVYDFGDIRDSGALFIRKVSWIVDKKLVNLLPVVKSRRDMSSDIYAAWEWDELPDFRWPSLGVKVKNPFVWEWENSKKKKEDEGKEEDAE